MFFRLREHWALHKISNEYDRCISQYGASPKGVHWRSEESQQQRFTRLMEIILPRHSSGGISIYDLGCGYGALFQRLANHSIMQSSTYTGYEINRQLQQLATTNISDPRARFVLGKHPQDFNDYGFISGTFNLKMSASKKFWWQYIQATLNDCWKKTRYGLAFNLLDLKKSASPHEKLFYCDPQKVIEFCQSKFTKNAIWKADSQLPDVHFYLWR